METKEKSTDEQLVELLSQLSQIQMQLAAIMSTRFERQTEENVQNRVEEKQESVDREANRYGQDPKTANAIIAEYENALQQIRQEYSMEKNLWLAQAEKFKNQEMKQTLEIARLKGELRNEKKQYPAIKRTSRQYDKETGLEIGNENHPVYKYNDVMRNLKNASLEDVAAQLDYYNGKPVLIDGASYHPFNEPVAAAKLNERYFELTGKYHPNFVKQAPEIIDGLNNDSKFLIEQGAYTPGYFETIKGIKENIEAQKKIENEKVMKKIDECVRLKKVSREASKESEMNIRACKDNCFKTIKSVSENKALAVNENKQNVFAKFFARIKDRIGGKEKFNENVIEPLKKKVTYIKEEVVPVVKENIQNEVIPKLKDLLEKGGEKVSEKVSELDLKGKFTQLMGMAKEGARTIVEKSKGLKEGAINAFSKGAAFVKAGVTKIAEKAANVMQPGLEI